MRRNYSLRRWFSAFDAAMNGVLHPLQTFLPVICLVLGSQAILGQTITGSVVGTVTDQTGAVIPSATVAATETSTGVKTSTVTNKDGLYNLRFLPIGSYTL